MDRPSSASSRPASGASRSSSHPRRRQVGKIGLPEGALGGKGNAKAGIESSRGPRTNSSSPETVASLSPRGLRRGLPQTLLPPTNTAAGGVCNLPELVAVPIRPRSREQRNEVATALPTRNRPSFRVVPRRTGNSIPSRLTHIRGLPQIHLLGRQMTQSPRSPKKEPVEPPGAPGGIHVSLNFAKVRLRSGSDDEFSPVFGANACNVSIEAPGSDFLAEGNAGDFLADGSVEMSSSTSLELEPIGVSSRRCQLAPTAPAEQSDLFTKSFVQSEDTATSTVTFQAPPRTLLVHRCNPKQVDLGRWKQLTPAERPLPSYALYLQRFRESFPGVLDSSDLAIAKKADAGHSGTAAALGLTARRGRQRGPVWR